VVGKIIGIFLIAVAAVGGWLAWAVMSPVTPSGPTYVMLRPGFTTHRIATELENAGVIRSQRAFVFWHYLHPKRSLKAGEYLFDKTANTIEVQKRLGKGDVYFHTVVVPEGFTMFDIARAIEAAGLGSADDFLKVAQSDTSIISDIAPNAHSLEGYLFPETYEFTRMMTMHDMAGAMVKQFRVVAHQIGLIDSPQLIPSSQPQPALPGESAPTRPQDQGNDVERTVIMASIVEKETSVPDERPLVASVYYNRLNNNVALDADPSIIYAELLAGAYQGALHHADMQFTSAYNTYRNAGLPPGPIGNPGRSSLEAAMHPAQSDYFYFVADAQGHHRFSKSFEEHNKNVAAYRKAMRGR
jgi:UPF0755 protein